jgi:L-lactate dehydrogenase complex protein LldF
VKIDLDAQLYRWRQLVVDAGEVSATKRAVATIGASVLASPRLVLVGGSLMRFAMRVLPAGVMRKLAGPWGRDRELPVPPTESFSAWYKAREKKGNDVA